jgi:hypothetical protein
MGYEILDAADAEPAAAAAAADAAPRGGPVNGPTATTWPPDVVELDALPEPGGAPPWVTVPWQRPNARRRPPGRLTSALVAVAALLGLAVGVALDHYHAQQVRESEARQRLQALAVVQSMTSRIILDGQLAELIVQVYNSGTHPLSVLVSPAGPSARIQVASGSRTVPPGGAQLVIAQVPLDCASNQPLGLTIPMQTVDGTEHQLAPRSDTGAPLDQSSQQELCTLLPDRQLLTAQLQGGLNDPLLQLTNDTEGPLTVSVDSGSPLTQVSSHRLSFKLVPALPMQIPAHGTRTVRIGLQVPGCIIGGNLPELSSVGFLGLRGDDPHGTQVAAASVDVGPLVGGVVARTCQ